MILFFVLLAVVPSFKIEVPQRKILTVKIAPEEDFFFPEDAAAPGLEKEMDSPGNEDITPVPQGEVSSGSFRRNIPESSVTLQGTESRTQIFRQEFRLVENQPPMLDFSKAAKGDLNNRFQISAGDSSRSLDVMPYIYAGDPRLPEFRRRRTQSGVLVSALFDEALSRWAEKTLAKIQANWILPPLSDSKWDASVSIRIIVNKKGEILALEIISFSEIFLLNQAALNAVKMSSPLPGLPESFEGESLEIRLDFQYDE